ncbi:MAG: DUF2127 domain-containing protein, partial [Humidesulfovibrio sp.]|nr:DUF2127 domain-containing protein [Humidesulfovibrio sp.]
VRVVEASGLWLRKAWAEWFGALAGGVYIPFVLHELARQVTWLRLFVLAVNLLVVGVLALELWRRRQARPLQASLGGPVGKGRKRDRDETPGTCKPAHSAPAIEGHVPDNFACALQRATSGWV